MTKEVLKLAFEALEFFKDTAICQADIDVATEAIAAIKEVLAQPRQEPTNIERHKENVQKFLGAPQPEQEPVAWINEHELKVISENVTPTVGHRKLDDDDVPLYTTLPQRTWVGLTDKAVTQVIDSMPKNMKGFMIDWDLYEFSKAIEAKLKQKNGYAEENT